MPFFSHRPALLGCLCFCLAVTSCTRSVQDPKLEVLAKVNGEPIYAGEFLANFHQLKAEQDEVSQKNPKLMLQLKTRALNEAIVMSLLHQEAARRHLKVAKEEVESRLSDWKDGYPPGGFEEMLKKQNTSEDLLRERIDNQLLVEKLSASVAGSETLVSDDEVKRYYVEHRSELYRPEKVHALQIVVPTKEEAEQLRSDILAKKLTFESAARTHSLSPDAVKGGDLGFFAKNEKIAAFNEAFNLPVGAISQPIQSRYGFHLLTVVEKQPAKKLDLGDAKPEIIKILQQEKQVRVYKEWVTKLLKEGDIYENEKLFQSLI